jgi:transporter family protein
MTYSTLSILLLVAVLMGGYNFFIKASSGHIHEVAGAVILQVIAAVLGGAALLFLKSTKTTIELSSKGIYLALAAGVCVGLAEIFSFYAFGKDVPVSVGLPIILGGTVLAGVALGMIFLGETLSLKQWIAMACIIVGVVLMKS